MSETVTAESIESELPELNQKNRAILGRLITHGGLGHAEVGPDGKIHGQVRVLPDQMIWEPSVLVVPHSGELELELYNDDANDHCAMLPSNGDLQWALLPVYSTTTATLNLDGPGCHWYGSTMGNNEGNGMLGAIVVLGDVPPHARLDRPPQPRP